MRSVYGGRRSGAAAPAAAGLLMFILMVLAALVAAPLTLAATTGRPAAGAALVKKLPRIPAPEHSTTGPTPPPNVRFNRLGYTVGPGEVVIPAVPAYAWRDGCGPTALGMVVGHYDGLGYDLLVPGSAATQTVDVSQMIASHGSVAAPLHYEDYALPKETSSTILPDKSELPTGDEHASDCLADFMRTSWSVDSLAYGWSYSNMIGPAFINYVKLKYPAFAPTSTTYYFASSLTWDLVKAEIDGSHPMGFLVDSTGDATTDHFVTAIGYREYNGYPEYACLDTWSTTAIRWQRFRAMSSSYDWGVWGGFTFRIGDPAFDELPPTTTVHGVDTLWHASPVAVSFSAVDNGSAGVAYTEFAVDGGPWQQGSALTLRTWRRGGNTGTHTVAYRSADNRGNVESTKTCQVKLDAIPPRTTDDSDGLPHTGTVRVTLTATDDHAGVQTTYVSVNGGAWQVGNRVTLSASGTHWIAYYSVDSAGNVEPARLCQVLIN